MGEVRSISRWCDLVLQKCLLDRECRVLAETLPILEQAPLEFRAIAAPNSPAPIVAGAGYRVAIDGDLKHRAKVAIRPTVGRGAFRVRLGRYAEVPAGVEANWEGLSARVLSWGRCRAGRER